MDNETKEKAAALAGEAKKKAIGIWTTCKDKVVALWKSGAKGKVTCIVGALVILGIIGAFTNDEEGGSDGDWTYSDRLFYWVVDGGATEDEGTVYGFDGEGLKVFQSTSEGVLVESTGRGDRMVWVVTKKRYEDGAKLAAGYYIRRGMMEYESLLGKRTVARYVEVTGSLLEKVKKQIKDKKAAEEKARKAEEEAREAARKAAVKALGLDVAGTRGGETKTITLPGGVQMEMAWCPAGTFMMGSNDGDDDEQPLHKVTLTKGFWMAKTEVTQAQWKSVMENNPSYYEGDNLPVERVNWNDCMEFCQKTGLMLPTEAEWEYACRAGTTGDFGGTGRLEDMGWYRDNSDERQSVGQKQPNEWGLYDMHGNVEEWCWDWKDDYPSGAVTNPRGTGSDLYRVHRGGSDSSIDEDCRSAARSEDVPDIRLNDIGFRPVARQD